jgi:hypothetical protein
MKHGFVTRFSKPEEHATIARVILSSTCVGNDGKSCPTLHGSLAPIIFSELDNSICIDLQLLLLSSNNITWIQHLFLSSGDQQVINQILSVLSKTRYFSSSIKRLTISPLLFHQQHVVDFLKEFCSKNVDDVVFTDSTSIGLSVVQPLCETFSKLKVINAAYSRDNMTDECVKVIANSRLASSLQHLGLAACSSITDAAMVHIGKLTNLRKLDMDTCYRITDEGVQHLDQLTSLEMLVLGRTGITDQGVKALANLTSLKSLFLYDLYINDDSVLHLANHLTSLQEINLSATNITDKSLEHLCKLSSLSRLWLSNNLQLTDDGLAHLAKLNSLELLSICDNTQISDAGLLHLVHLPLLDGESLFASGCESVTEEGREEFQKQLDQNQANLKSLQ